MKVGSGRLRRMDRLRSSRDYKRIGQRGRRHASSCFVVLVAPRGTEEPRAPRLGVTVSRRVGGAVVRNRVKRRIREWFRTHTSSLDAVDVVVIARPAAARLTGPATQHELSRIASETQRARS